LEIEWIPFLSLEEAGLIGSNFIVQWLAHEQTQVVNVSKLTYAGNLNNLLTLAGEPRHIFVRGDICDRERVINLLKTYRPVAIVHFAAETHVDRSIWNCDDFIRTNVQGILCLLEAARQYLRNAPASENLRFGFLNISTDEVYGELRPGEPAFTEATPYSPNSPYSASKAAADHLVRAYHRIYEFRCMTTNCSNNYRPYSSPKN
jgi:dTDP-glucose 4,6-dehydratase